MTFEGPEWEGVRQSQLRILDVVDAEGSRAVDVAKSLGMTKQGAGQLVAGLVERGWLEQVPDPKDRRARLLIRTETGNDMCARVRHVVEAIEADWADRVGQAEYAVFRSVLSCLAAPAE